jgi:predicted amidohydrolase
MHLRVAACAFPLAPVTEPAAWVASVRAQVRFAADGGARLVVLPEYVTAPLLALDRRWEAWTELWRATARDCAKDWAITVLAGSHIVAEAGRTLNRALLARPDGSLVEQDKLHPTPWERGWGVAESHLVRLADVDGARVATLTCYDIEFPECARAAARGGAEVLLVPSWTDDRHGFDRVRGCARARAIENGVAVVHAPLIGGSTVPDFEQACGTAGVITPCDTGFPPGGIAAEGGWCQPGMVLADIDLDLLRRLRTRGTVTPLADARPEASYRVG